MICPRAKTAIRLSVHEFAKASGSLEAIYATLPGGGVGLDVVAFAAFFRRFLRRWRKNPSFPKDGLRLWERHKSGGWHAHFIFPGGGSALVALKKSWRASGGGRVSSITIPAGDAGKMATYLMNEYAKFSQKDFSDQSRAVRSWAVWGDMACRSSQVVLESPIGGLLRLWGPLREGRKYRILCGLRNLARVGLLPVAGSTPLQQWRAIRKYRITCRYSTGVLRLRIIGTREDGRMQITARCMYVSQRVMSYKASKGVNAGQTVRSLEVTVLTEDQSPLVLIMRLPPDATDQVKPLGVMGKMVDVSICQLRVWNKLPEIIIESVVPAKV